MRITRVHVDMPLAAGTPVALPAEAAGHLLRVLRLGVGDACVLFNGDGLDHPGRIVEAGKHGASVLLEPGVAVERESPLRLVLLQGIARGDKMDLILQKATELGVAAIVPVFSRRSEVRLDGARAEKRHQHWRNVVVAACEQSGRARVPDVAEPAGLASALDALPEGTMRLTLDPEGDATLSKILPDPEAGIVIAIGPEGGWAPEDLERLAGAGFRGLRLGPRVLRTETAGLAAIAALQARFGDFA